MWPNRVYNPGPLTYEVGALPTALRGTAGQRRLDFLFESWRSRCRYIAALQIRRGSRDNLGIISHLLHKNIFCDPSLEPSQNMFSLRNKKNYL